MDVGGLRIVGGRGVGGPLSGLVIGMSRIIKGFKGGLCDVVFGFLEVPHAQYMHT